MVAELAGCSCGTDIVGKLNILHHHPLLIALPATLCSMQPYILSRQDLGVI
jgi:hypothetical protein